jgi:hypothetical protein
MRAREKSISGKTAITQWEDQRIIRRNSFLVIGLDQIPDLGGSRPEDGKGESSWSPPNVVQPRFICPPGMHGGDAIERQSFQLLPLGRIVPDQLAHFDS